MTGPDKNENNYDRLWNIKTLSDQLSAKFYNLSEHLPVDEVIGLFKGKVILTNINISVKRLTDSAT